MDDCVIPSEYACILINLMQRVSILLVFAGIVSLAEYHPLLTVSLSYSIVKPASKRIISRILIIAV